MTDAFHLLTDLLTFSTSIIAMRLARKSPTNKYKFGFYRAEILAALFRYFKKNFTNFTVFNKFIYY